jgi:hypothetical protein
MGKQNQAAEVMLIAQLLGLLVTFIGESLMLSLLLDAWPDLRQGVKVCDDTLRLSRMTPNRIT